MQTRPNSPCLNDILAREREVWRALQHGDAAADEALLSDDYLGVYATGYGDRADHVAQLAAGATVADYRIDEARLLPLGPDLALLAYRAAYRRIGAPEAGFEHMYVSSIWRREDGVWRNLFSQDTEAGDLRPV